MREHYTRVFTDSKVLKEMLALRAKGRGYSSLARRYGVDHSSIMYQCHKYHIEKNEAPKDLDKEIEEKNTKIVYKQKEEEIVIVIRTKHKYEDLIFEKVNEGKNYVEYVPKKDVPTGFRKKYRLD